MARKYRKSRRRGTPRRRKFHSPNRRKNRFSRRHIIGDRF